MRAACVDHSDGQTCDLAGLRGSCHGGICLVGDDDADGVLGTSDNCPLTVNSGQEDRDVDGFGDACDYCPDLGTLRNHDEDHDSVGDECDLCPHILDYQDDPDGDHVSAPCENGSTVMSLIAFDPFVEQGVWASTTTTWQTDGDSIAPASRLDPADPGLANVQIHLTTTDELVIDLGFTSQQAWETGDRFGIGVVDAQGTRFVACEIVCRDVVGCRLEATFADGSVKYLSASTFTESRLRVEMHKGLGAGEWNVNPHIDGSTSYPTFIGPLPGLDGTAVISASPKIRLRYYAAWASVR